MELEEASAQAVMCHGVWTLAQVSSTPVQNRYGPLAEEEEEETIIMEDPLPPPPTASQITRRPKMKRVARRNWKLLEDGCHCGGDHDALDICNVNGEGDKGQMGITFQVADVVKPLISVKRLVEKGNCVSFGPDESDNFIENRNLKSKVGLVPTAKGSYLLKVNFAKGRETEIVVDSGAEENVCPKWWGDQFGLNGSGRMLNLRNASGGKIQHWGQREVLVESPF